MGSAQTEKQAVQPSRTPSATLASTCQPQINSAPSVREYPQRGAERPSVLSLQLISLPGRAAGSATPAEYELYRLTNYLGPATVRIRNMGYAF